MIQLGKFQTLRIDRFTSVGFYLEDKDTGEDILFPQKYITDEMEVNDEIEVFVYKDSEERLVATTETPACTAGQYGYLEVGFINNFGAFMEWGVTKNLFVPFRNQARKMEIGKSYIVFVYEDNETERLVGATKVNKYLRKEAGEEIEKGDEVDLLVRGYSDIGVNVIVNDRYMGLVYRNEIFKPLRQGDRLKGYVKPMREDRKLDISLSPIGHTSIEPNAQRLLKRLQAKDGFLPFTDKTDPDRIREVFGMSKKQFKKAIGALYKQRLIELKDNGMYLAGKE